MSQYRQGTQRADDSYSLFAEAVRVAIQHGLHARTQPGHMPPYGRGHGSLALHWTGSLALVVYTLLKYWLTSSEGF